MPAPDAARPPLTLIVSPKATGCSPARIARLTADLQRTHTVRVHELRGPGDVVNAITAADTLVAVAGGDGTIREAAALLQDREATLAVFPVGTANVIAHALGISTDAEALRALRTGPVVPWRMFAAGGTPFLLCLGAGVDAEACRTVSRPLKERTGKAAYAAAFLRTLAAYGFPRFAVDGRDGLSQALLLTCGWYAGRLRLTRSRVDDDRLELLALQAGRWGLLPALLHLGWLRTCRTCAAVSGCTLDAPPGTVPYELDGDFSGYLPVSVEPAGVVRFCAGSAAAAAALTNSGGKI